MNVAFFLTPKVNTVYLYDDSTLRQGLEKLHHHGYTAVPVITRDGKYVGTVSEGDFLWYLVERCQGKLCKVTPRSMENKLIRDVLNIDRNPPVDIAATMDMLFTRATQQNFIPVIDDAGSFIGIVTRRNVLRYIAQQAKAQQLA
ncbi:MAG: CBS domain-containing protein [Oscillospiraceae bacterium]|jgi:CBS domain-containing protein